MAREFRRPPSTKRGTATYEALPEAGGAIGVNGAFQAFIAAICRRSRIDNGAFCRCFPDKEHIFLTLVERATNELQARLKAVVDPTAPAPNID